MHWAYQAIDNLHKKGILKGYPDGNFRGGRTLTRFELAVAVQRILDAIGVTSTGIPGQRGIPGDVGPMGPAGPQGEQGPAGPSGLTPEDIANIRRLVGEFSSTLDTLKNNNAAINRRLDDLGRAAQDLKNRLDMMPMLYGGAYFAVRSDRADGGYADVNGRPLSSIGPGSLVNTPATVNWFGLGLKANINGGAKLNAQLAINNYTNFEGGTIGQFRQYNLNPDTDVTLRRLEITSPFTGFGSNGQVTFGRFGHRCSRFVLWRPNVDLYFNNPFEQDGDFTMDGVKLNFNVGSLGVEMFGAQTQSVRGTGGFPWNSPLAGTTNPLGFQLFTGGFKPSDQPNQGQLTIDQLAGISLNLGIRQLQGGHVRFTAMGATGQGSAGINPITNLFVLGSDFDLKLTDRLNVAGDWAKTITGTGRFNTVNPYENNAFNVGIGFGSGPLHVRGGYKYIDPLFYAPGYWGRIGNWVNPTNIQGPTFRAEYNATPNFGVNIGSDCFTGARNRASVGGLTQDDEIHRILVGLRWDIAKNFHTTVDWEGVYWSLEGAHSGIPALGTGRVHPTEHYVTFGTGLDLTSNTTLRFLYQIGDFDGHGALNNGGGFRSNFNTFTSSVAVRF
jgi:hypothetical protein